jgi:hypothetical protein
MRRPPPQAYVEVKNYLRAETTYKVETDLPYVTGDSGITIPASGSAKYEIAVAPQVRGNGQDKGRLSA